MVRWIQGCEGGGGGGWLRSSTRDVEMESEIQRGNTEVEYGENHLLEVVTWRGVSAVFARYI